MAINKINSITETVDFIKKNKIKNNFVYSWNRVDSNSSNFGDGLIFCNTLNSQKSEKKLNIFKSTKPKSLRIWGPFLPLEQAFS